jgi:hypothetical protein
MSRDGKKPKGLGVAACFAAGATLSNRPEAITLQEIKQRLNDLAPDGEAIPPTRQKIIQLLGVLVEVLDPITWVQIGTVDDKILVTPHATVKLLIETADLLRDLDNGLTCPTFMPNSYGATASLKTKKRKQQEAWAETLEILKKTKRLNLKTTTEAAEYLAKRLNAAGHRTQKRHPISREHLMKLKHRPKKKPLKEES